MKKKKVSLQAELLGQRGRGIASISNMLNVTRLHNAAGSVGAMRRYRGISARDPEYFKIQSYRWRARLLYATRCLRDDTEGVAAAYANAGRDGCEKTFIFSSFRNFVILRKCAAGSARLYTLPARRRASRRTYGVYRCRSLITVSLAQESGAATPEEALTCRLLTPVIKAYTAKMVSIRFNLSRKAICLFHF